jgi:hypothetical protein
VVSSTATSALQELRSAAPSVERKKLVAVGSLAPTPGSSTAAELQQPSTTLTHCHLLRALYSSCEEEEQSKAIGEKNNEDTIEYGKFIGSKTLEVRNPWMPFGSHTHTYTQLIELLKI